MLFVLAHMGSLGFVILLYYTRMKCLFLNVTSALNRRLMLSCLSPWLDAWPIGPLLNP